jgi:cytidylate kinase
MGDTHTTRCLVEAVRRSVTPRESFGTRPFLTISRQYGCGGFALALQVQRLLGARGGPRWSIYSKEIIQQLATEMQSSSEVVQRERRRGREPIVEFFRSLSAVRTPSSHEVRHRTAMLIRELVAEGEAIIVGLGGAAATREMPTGLAIRLEAPMEWRVRQVALHQGVNEEQARERLDKVEQEREYLHELYAKWFPRKPAFHLTFDASVFELEDIAQNVAWLLGRMPNPRAHRPEHRPGPITFAMNGVASF